MSTHTRTVYDPPEARHGSGSTAGDLWALGVSLFEALTRRPPSGLGEPTAALVLPADFSPAFRDVVARCLNPNPQDRPSAAELVAWAGGRSAGSALAAPVQPAELAAPEPRTPAPAPPQSAPRQAAPDAARPAPSSGQSLKLRALLTVMLGAVVILALVWTGARVFRTHRAPSPPPVQGPGGSLSQTASAAPPAAGEVRAPVSAVSTTKAGRSDAAPSPSALHEVIPDVPRSARRTIRGHIRVWVRIIVDQDGSVFAAVADRTGPSRYIQQLAVEAAKRWTFPPLDTPSQRLMQLRFDFTRDGTTGRAVTLH